jgi:AcrR family transcriptional regulator
MTRVVKEYDIRKNEILDTAQKLFYTVGYDNTTVNAIIDDAGIAKGTFYHYFESKLDLLDNLVNRVIIQIEESIKPVLEKRSSAVEKLRELIRNVGAVKMDNRDILLQVIKVLYRDTNLITRHKMYMKSIEIMGPVYSKIIRQGVSEGVFNTQFPEDAGELILRLGSGMGDVFCELLLELDERPEKMEILWRKLRLYENTIERVLGVEEGLLKLFDREQVEKFLGQKTGYNGGKG